MSIANRKRPNEPAIVVPKPSEESPRFGRVGIIAGVGFVVGIAWPGIAQLELVPRPPNDAKSKSVASAEMVIPSGLTMPPLAPSAGVASLPAKSNPAVPRVKQAEVVSCVDADGKKYQKCGELSLDKVLTEPLRSLVACDGAVGQSGVLSLGFDVDFDDGKLSSFTVGRSTTLPAIAAQSMLVCAQSVLSKLDFSGIDHTFNRYRVFYRVELLGSASGGKADPPVAAAPSPEASGAAGSADVQGASGRATVAWEVALVRAAPKDGAVVARVLGGTRVVVTGHQGDWYRVKYNAKGDEGFVFKAALGM